LETNSFSVLTNILSSEIVGLFLSEIICHEIGHHAHRFKRHAFKRDEKEKFADRYAKAGYFNYLKLRKKQILGSYKKASLNIFLYDKKARQTFSTSRQELIDWLDNNPNGIKFP